MKKIKLSNGIEISYKLKQGKKGAETIVFLNGTFSLMEDWDQAADHLSNTYGYSILTFDMRNQGQSTKILTEFEYEDLVKDIELFFNALELNTVSIITYSSASTLAIDYINRNPEKVRRLVMGAPAVNPHGAFKNKLIHDASVRLLELSNMNDLVTLTYPLMFSNGFCHQNEKYFGAIQNQFDENYKKELMLPYMRAWGNNNMDLEKISFAAKKAETYFIYGEQDILNNRENVELLRAELDQLTIHEVPNVGHGFHAENMEYYINLLNSIFETKQGA